MANGNATITKADIEKARKSLGQVCQFYRMSKGIPKVFFVREGLRLETIEAIEYGERGYTADSLILYAQVLGMKITID